MTEFTRAQKCGECANYIPKLGDDSEDDDCSCKELSDDAMFVICLTGKKCLHYTKRED